MVSKEFPRLTMKTARALAEQVIGTAKGLTKVKSLELDTYEMYIGDLAVTIRHDWFGKSGCLLLSICAYCNGGTINMLFDTETLVEDFEAEKWQKQRDNRERLQEWMR